MQTKSHELLTQSPKHQHFEQQEKEEKKHNTKTKMRNEAVVKRTKMTWCSVINTFQLKKISS